MCVCVKFWDLRNPRDILRLQMDSGLTCGRITFRSSPESSQYIEIRTGCTGVCSAYLRIICMDWPRCWEEYVRIMYGWFTDFGVLFGSYRFSMSCRNF